jgi:hypothetical protein
VEPIRIDGAAPVKRGPKPRAEYVGLNHSQRMRASRAKKGQARKDNIAVLDFETDPFSDDGSEIMPFVCELYSDRFSPIVIWEDDPKRFADKVVSAIEAIPDEYTIYAHNGGKFDFMYLVHKLRGIVKFKGRAIMSARFGSHEIRDSLHIIPEKLSAWKKDNFDYDKLKKSNRYRCKKEILDYLHSDCVYLFQIVKSFILEFGFKISIGQAAFSELKKHYKVSNVSEQTDEFTRRYFFGGRVECFAGAGHYDNSDCETPYSMYDVNSMYPYCMANFQHPIGNEYNWRRGSIGKDTIFLDVECRNYGAFVRRLEDGETGAPVFGERARYYTTVWEYNAAIDYDLIEDVEIIGVVDNAERSDFSKFIIPMYDRRQTVKSSIADLHRSIGYNYYLSPEFERLKKEDLFLKYLLTNAFGKFAQNPRRFKEYYYTDLNSAPDDEWMSFLEGQSDEFRHEYGMPIERGEDFAVWCKPSPGKRYNNVGTAASITGAARSILLRAMQGSVDPIYCDTDCIVARSISGVEIHKSKLGAWDKEETYDEIIIAGKKLYAAKIHGLPDDHERRIKARCKGSLLTGDARDALTRNGQTWQNYRNLIAGHEISMVNKTPTFNRIGEQYFMRRRIRATAPSLSKPVLIRGNNYARSPRI